MRWPAAAATLGSAGMYAVVLASAGWAELQGLVAVVMTLTCLVCAAHLIARPHRRAWAHASVASAAMLVAHPVMMVTAGHAQHASLGPVGDALAWGMLLAPGLSLAVAFYGFMVSRSARLTS